MISVNIMIANIYSFVDVEYFLLLLPWIDNLCTAAIDFIRVFLVLNKITAEKVPTNVLCISAQGERAGDASAQRSVDKFFGK